MPKIVITAVYAFEPDMSEFPECQSIEDVQRFIQQLNNREAEDKLLHILAFEGYGVLDTKVEIDRSDEG